VSRLGLRSVSLWWFGGSATTVPQNEDPLSYTININEARLSSYSRYSELVLTPSPLEQQNLVAKQDLKNFANQNSLSIVKVQLLGHHQDRPFQKGEGSFQN
jgi:hypothetical protein